MEFIYHIEGMHCAACVEKIKSALSTHFKTVEVTLDPPLLKIEADTLPLISDLNIILATTGNYRVDSTTHTAQQPINPDTKVGLSAYYPIFLIAAYIIGVASINNFLMQEMNWQGWMFQFMAGFFLVFSAFKFLDIVGFAEGYATYDLLAKHWHAYGFIYPFLELSLGILYLTQWFPTATQIATVIIMGFSSFGVINSLLKKQKFQCACLGTLLKVPLSSITLIEDLVMVVLAALELIM
jgi:copper chaperone CopZ